jgi:YD repeat-containing protein
MRAVSNVLVRGWPTPVVMVAFLLCYCIAPAAAQDVIFVHDELGRLVGVTDPAGDTAVYRYDAVGNVESITRQPSTSVSVIHLTPSRGPIGTTVIVHGTGFSTTPAENTVTFNGTAASVASATLTALTVTVPAEATTGTLAVTAPAGAAQSPAPFTVTASAAPIITSVTPKVGAVGSQVTLEGVWFHPVPSQNAVRFNTTLAAAPSTGTATELQVTVPAGGTSGRLSLTTSGGTATGPDVFVPASPYVAADVASTGRFAVDGPALQVAIPVAQKIGLAVFDVVADQRINLRVQPSGSSSIQVRRPDGTSFFGMSVGILAAWSDVRVVPVTGTYTATVDPGGSGTGTTTLTLFNVPPDFLGTIEMDAFAVVPIIAPGQNGRLTFEGTIDQRVSLFATHDLSGAIRILRPDDTVLVSTPFSTFGPYIDTTVLPTSGTYTVEVDPSGGSTGGATVYLHEVPPDLHDGIVPNGPPVMQTYGTPGQIGTMTFSGTEGQRVSLTISGGPQGSVKLLDPASSVLTSTTISLFPKFIEPVTLTQSGTHTILIDLSAEKTGSMTVTLYDVPADLSGTLAVNGSATPVTIAGPGQKGSFTFAGTTGQAVTVRVTDNTIGTTTVRLFNPSGEQLTSKSSSATSFNLNQQTLPADGSYTVVADPSGDRTGALNLSVTNP